MKKTNFVISSLLFCLLCTGSFMPHAYAQTPTLSLENSIPIAQEAVKKENLNLANYYLYSITYANSSKGSYWYYTIRSKQPSEYNEFFIKVYMNQTTEISGGAFSKRR